MIQSSYFFLWLAQIPLIYLIGVASREHTSWIKRIASFHLNHFHSTVLHLPQPLLQTKGLPGLRTTLLRSQNLLVSLILQNMEHLRIGNMVGAHFYTYTNGHMFRNSNGFS